MKSTASFGDSLDARVAERESQIVLGLDPDPSALWPAAAAAAADISDPVQAAAAAVRAHCLALLDAAAHACVAVKPQLARFELLGAAGWAALEDVTGYARELGLLVIADGKRGDIDVTAAAYAGALLDGAQSPFGRLPGLGVDMTTVNPLMGSDAVEPFVQAARRAGAGVLVLVRTSNPGAADVQDLRLEDGSAVWESIARLVASAGEAGIGESAISDVGAVIGATVPAHLQRARELMPNAPFLLPGIGAQGGRVEDLAPAFTPGRAGGLISASRSIAGAHMAHAGEPAHAAAAEAERLRERAWQLSGQATAAI